MEIQQIIEGLECLVTKQHRCGACPFNPHPGMDWPYGCGKGQGDVARAARKALERIEDPDANYGVPTTGKVGTQFLIPHS